MSKNRMHCGAVTVLYAALLLGLNACSSDAPTAPAAVTPVASPPVTPPVGATAAGSAAPITRPTGTGTPGAAGSAAPPVGSTPPPGGVSTPPPPAAPGGAPTAGGPSTPPPPTGTAAAASDWTSMSYDGSGSYNNIGETKISKTSVANLKEAWTADMGGNVNGAALLVGDKVFASGANDVRAFNAADGTMLWQGGMGSTSSLSYADGTIYQNADDAMVYAYSAADGKMLWSKQPDAMRSDGNSSPIVAGDLILIGGSNGNIELGGGSFRGYLSALNRLTGDVAWTTFTTTDGSTGASIWSSASADVAGGFAYGSTGNNYGVPATDTSDAILQFDLKTGEMKWKAQRLEGDTGVGAGIDYDFGANPILYEVKEGEAAVKLVAGGAKSGSAHAMKRDTGELVWTRSLGSGSADGSSGIFTNGAWSGKYIIVACNTFSGATLYGLDGATGDIGWMRNLSGKVWGRIALANGVGFVGTGSTLEAFDTDTGAMIKTFMSKGGTVASTVTVGNGRVAFGEGLSWSGGVSGKTITVLSVE